MEENKKIKPNDRDINEALAILYKREGEYEKSIDLYILVLVDLSQSEIISALYINANIKFNDVSSTTNQHIIRFDNMIMEIIKICDKYGSRLPEAEQENLWLHAIRSLYKIK